jgi:hypothetical protein
VCLFASHVLFSVPLSRALQLLGTESYFEPFSVLIDVLRDYNMRLADSLFAKAEGLE